MLEKGELTESIFTIRRSDAVPISRGEFFAIDKGHVILQEAPNLVRTETIIGTELHIPRVDFQFCRIGGGEEVL